MRRVLIILIAVILPAALAGTGCAPPGGKPPSESCEDTTPVYDPFLDPGNLYLGELVDSEWDPGTAGPQRKNWSCSGEKGGTLQVTDENGDPVKNNGALGPPEGGGSWESRGTYTCVGIGGSAAWKFEEGRHIYNGPGTDFITFASNFAWGGRVDGLVCELARVEVSADGIEWFSNDAEEYRVNPDPDAENPGYEYRETSGLHGNNPTWANYVVNTQAQEIVSEGGGETWADIPGECISIYFEPDDPCLGGVGFDLDTFVSKDTGAPWPGVGEMRYLRITDDPEILDGQDYNKDWCLGANLTAAMGVNVASDD